jgi:hypothetical protein
LQVSKWQRQQEQRGGGGRRASGNLASVPHIFSQPCLAAVLYPVMAANQGGPMLPYVVGSWATALLTGGMGLMGGGAAKAAAGRV